MNRLLLLPALAATLCFSNNSFAQVPGAGTVAKIVPEPTVGIKLGANFNQLSGNSLKESYKAGIMGGAFVGLRKGKIGVRVEALLNSAKYTYSISATQDGTFKNLYLDIPVLFEYKIVSRLWAQAGPQFTNTLSVSANPNPDPSKDPKDYFKSSFSGVLGLEAKLPAHITAGARYILGVTDVRNAEIKTSTGTVSGAWMARTIQLYVGFRFI